MKLTGLGKGLSALIPDDIREDFEEQLTKTKQKIAKEKEEDKGSQSRVKRKLDNDDEDVLIGKEIAIKSKNKAGDKGSKDEALENMEENDEILDQVVIEEETGSEIEELSYAKNLKPQDEEQKQFKNKAETTKQDKKDKIKNKQNLEQIYEIELEKIISNSKQPRKDFNDEAIQSLAQSIKNHGLINPITVLDKQDGFYEIIAGERRLRAFEILEKQKIPCIIKKADNKKKLELALIENLQRKDLNPMEVSMAYKMLVDEFGLTHEEVADRMGKGASSIANYLRFLKLPEVIQEGLAEGKIDVGHAKVILSVTDPKVQIELFNKAVKYDLSVHNLDNIIKGGKQRLLTKAGKKLSPVILKKEKLLSDSLGLKVNIKPKGQGSGGKIIVQYYDDGDLDRLLEVFE